MERIVSHSFPGHRRPDGWLQRQREQPIYGDGITPREFVGRADGQVVAALEIIPFRQWIAGEALPMAGIGMVTIAPTHRKRGLGAQLVAAAVVAAHERGDIASALYPFRNSFYQKLGYGQAGEALQYQIPPSALPDASERKNVLLLEGKDARAEALLFYLRWIRTQNGQLERNHRLWHRLCGVPDEGEPNTGQLTRALVGYRGVDGALSGYALIVYRTDLPRTQRYLEVEEIAWLDATTRRGLYGWLASLGDQWEHIMMRALPGQRLGDIVSEPRLPHGTAPNWGLWAPGATLMMGPMFRLLDLQAAWKRRAVVDDGEDAWSVGLEVVDAQLAHNAGTWRLGLEAHRVVVDRKGKADLNLRLNISTLSRLYIAALSPAAALEAGLLECDRPNLLPRLGAALALPEPWTFDRF